MTSAFEKFFDGRIFVINVAARQDRMAHFDAMAKRVGFAYTRFEATTGMMVDGRVNNNASCTNSHQRLLEMQIANGWPRLFAYEDDCDIIYRDFHERWERFERELPADWDQLFLGGGYAEPPLKRLSPHVIRCGRMMTTSSYGIALAHAKRVAPALIGIGPVDSAMAGFQREALTVVISPRVAVQYPNFSDLQGCHMSNAMSMLDTGMEAHL